MQRNCVIVRRGEKHVAAYYIALADMCLPLLQQSWVQLKKVAVQINDRREEGRFDPYIANVIIPLVRMQR